MLISATDGVRLEARSVGSGAPLVFVHEFSSDARSWDPQVGFFSRHYHCTAYCARGYPPSDMPQSVGAYDQIRAAEDLADVVRAVCDGPAHIVGLSMGGFAALHFGLRHPQLVRSLVVAGVGYGAKLEQQAEHSAASKRDADHAEAIGMAAFARNLAASHYAQCLRAKDQAAWLRFVERLAEHSVIGMAMTLRACSPRGHRCGISRTDCAALTVRSCSLPAMRTRLVSNPVSFSRRRCPMLRSASCRVPDI